MQDGEAPVTAVKIYGQTYHVRSDNPEHVRRLAQLLDGKMKEVSQQTPTVDSLKVAVLAALNIVDGHLALQRQLETLRQEISRESDRMVETLEAARGL